MYTLRFTPEADQNLTELENNKNLHKRLKAVRKALCFLENNPRHQSLNTHKHTFLSREYKKEIFEAYAENKTPQAYRIFWHYAPNQKEITIIAITPHP